MSDVLRCAKSRESRERFYAFIVNEGFDKLFAGYGKEYGIDQYIQEKNRSLSVWDWKRDGKRYFLIMMYS